MTDLEIIKLIEKDFNLKFEKLNSGQFYKLNDYLENTRNSQIQENIKKFPVAYYTKKYNGNEMVKAVIITACKLTKIPELIYSFKNLETLFLLNNEIKEISSAIINLKKLRYLNLSNNKLEQLPEVLYKFSEYNETNMEYRYYFDFSNNNIQRIHRNAEEFLLITNEITRESAIDRDEPRINMIGNHIKYPPLQMLKDKNFAWIEYYENQNKLITKTVSFNELDKALPFGIKSIRANNYQELNNVFIQNIEVDAQWIFITGENGYGKTSLLQSIVIGFLGNEDENTILNREGEIILEYKNKEENIVNITNNKFDYADDFQYFAAYGPARLIKNPKYINESKTASLFNSYSELLDIEDKLEKWEKDSEQNKYFESAKSILLQLFENHISDIIVERIASKVKVKYKETESSAYKTFEQLASGYKSIIAMIGDIMIRLLESQPEITNFNQLAGIVLIDEIDLHLHPKWQKAMVEKLTKTFPKIQFIASTHSPIPILGAPKNTVIINVQRNKKGITAEKLDIDFKTLLPNTLLSSPIFGFEEYLPTALKDMSKLRTEKGYNEILFNNEVERRINKMMEAGLLHAIF